MGNMRQQYPPFKSLMKAFHHSRHPKLVDIMKFTRLSVTRANDSTDDVLYTKEDIEKWEQWRDDLRRATNWQSSCIQALIDIFNRLRDLDPDSCVIILDESVYFLDIVQIAFDSMHDPVECLRYDDREAPETRSNVLEEFKQADGSKVLLMTRAAGGVGLKIPCANVVILCGPWWKKEWEIQAAKRVWCPGQRRWQK
jgi:SNF2 family DNA or RNA helicase